MYALLLVWFERQGMSLQYLNLLNGPCCLIISDLSLHVDFKCVQAETDKVPSQLIMCTFTSEFSDLANFQFLHHNLPLSSTLALIWCKHAHHPHFGVISTILKRLHSNAPESCPIFLITWHVQCRIQHAVPDSGAIFIILWSVQCSIQDSGET